MLIDLHIHTRRGSSCSVLHTKDLIRRAKEIHLDAVCITDHNTTKAVERVKKIGTEQGLLVMGGIEVRCREGDILVFGLENSPHSGIMAQDLADLVHHEGGVVIPAHPFRSSAPSLGSMVFEVHGFDAIEVLNGNSNDDENRTAREASQKLCLPGTGGSDSHSLKHIGRCITEFEDNSISSEQDLIRAIKEGKYQPKRLSLK